jgi:hypothetical protein
LYGEQDYVDWEDIKNRKIIYNNTVNAWPTNNRAMINTTEYDNLADALGAAISGDTIKLGPGSFYGSFSEDTNNLNIIGSGIDVTFITYDDTFYTFLVDNVTVNFDNLTIENSAADALRVDGASGQCTLTNVRLNGAGDDLETNSTAVTILRGVELVNNAVNQNGTVEFSGWSTSPSGDIFPAGDRRGIFTRFVNNGVTPTWHFRKNTIPPDYDWASGFNVPDFTALSYLKEYFLGYFFGTDRAFLAKSTTSALVGQYIWGRFIVNNLCNFGLRIDDGTDNNYVEYRIVHVSGPSYILRLRQRTGGGSVTVTDVTNYSTALPAPLMFHPSGSMGSWKPDCYIVNETGSDLGGGLTQVLSGSTVSWNPARVGICLDDVGASIVDWIAIP